MHTLIVSGIVDILWILNQRVLRRTSARDMAFWAVCTHRDTIPNSENFERDRNTGDRSISDSGILLQEIAIIVMASECYRTFRDGFTYAANVGP